MHQPGVDVRPLRHISGEVEFNEVFLDQARVPDFGRLGDVNDGWRVAGATLSSERQMVAGAGSGGSGRVGGSGVDRLLKLAREHGLADDPMVRQRLAALWSEERIRAWTNQRVASNLAAGQTPGPAASIGKVHQAGLNQRVQAAAVDLLGADATAWDVDGDVPARQRRLLRVVAVRDQRHAAQPGQHHRGRHHRGQQEHPRRARARPAARARRLARQALERDPTLLSAFSARRGRGPAAP